MEILLPIKNNNLDRFLIKIVDVSYIKTLSDNLYGKFIERYNDDILRCIYCYEDNYKLFLLIVLIFIFKNLIKYLFLFINI